VVLQRSVSPETTSTGNVERVKSTMLTMVAEEELTMTKEQLGKGMFL
jgi:hypothetical protein